MHITVSRHLIPATLALVCLGLSCPAAEDRYLSGGEPYAQIGHAGKYPAVIAAEQSLMRALRLLEHPSRTNLPARDAAAALACRSALTELHLAVAFADQNHHPFPTTEELARIRAAIAKLAPATSRGTTDPVALFKEAHAILALAVGNGFGGHIPKAMMHCRHAAAALTH